MQVKLIKPVLKKPTANTMLNNKNDWIPSWFRETKKKKPKKQDVYKLGRKKQNWLCSER
jgi:hypothetical protein